MIKYLPFKHPLNHNTNILTRFRLSIYKQVAFKMVSRRELSADNERGTGELKCSTVGPTRWQITIVFCCDN